jgi:5-formyltetrahydrofolate cyclo-ligase
MTDTIADTKQKLRDEYLQLRMGLSGVEIIMATQRIVSHLLEAVPADAHIIAAYQPIRNEMDVRSACAAFSERGQQLCLPVMAGKDQPLIFRRWLAEVSLVDGPHDIAIPPESEPEMQPDVILVPTLVFDNWGRRLGYGAGYYDRTIAALRERNPAVQCIGVGYAKQLVAELPAEPHDQTLDVIVTEEGVSRFK